MNSIMTAAIPLAAFALVAHAGEAQQATAQLEDTLAAYQAVPGLEDRLDYEVTMPDGTVQRDGFGIVLGSNGDAFADLGRIQAAKLGDTFYLASGASGPYIASPATNGFVPSMMAAVQGIARIPPPPQIVMRDGVNVDMMLMAFGFGLAQGLAPVSIDSANGISTVTCEGNQSSLTLTIDERTDLVTSFELSAAGMSAKAKMQPKILESGDGAIAFDPAERIEVSSAADLMRIGPNVGSKAPDLTFAKADGSTVSLADLRGSTVVLEFWASWCGNCRVSLPQVQEVAQWADAEGLDVTVLALNSRDRAKDPWPTQAQWWSQLDLSLDAVFDTGNAAAEAFRATAFPQLVVIGPDGTITHAKAGFDPDGVESLKAAITAAKG